MTRFRFRPCLWLFALAVLPAAGCGSFGTPVVSGKVTFKSTPLTGGEVSFISAGGGSRSALITSDGRYEISDPPKGEVTIIVTSTKVKALPGQAGISPFGGPKGAEAKGGGNVVTSLIPPKYADPAASPLRYTVGSGRQSYDIELAD